MKKIKNSIGSEFYRSPELEVIELNVADIITTSPGTETPSVEETDGIWDLNIG